MILALEGWFCVSRIYCFGGPITLSFVVICETLVLIGCCLFWFDLKLFY